MLNNPLLDKDFLSRLDHNREREVYAKVIALSFDEIPLESIEGKIKPGGTINIDGNSAVRRSCSFQMVTQDVSIHDFYWSLKTKFRLFIGLKNTIEPKYPEIIWFPKGIYVISSFSVNHTVNGLDISIQGKDKMSLLNGELSGNITEASVDFGTIEIHEKDRTVKKHIPIKDIIQEAVHQYAKEPWYNIIINDLDDFGVELLDYRGTKPMYLFISADPFDDTYEVINMSMNDHQQIWVDTSTLDNKYATPDTHYVESNVANLRDDNQIWIEGFIYDPRIELHLTDNPVNPTRIKFEKTSEKTYTLAKVEYGQTVGYRLTDLVYPGDLIVKAGAPVTTVLDAIKQMLGNFEYFYDIDGRFIFQRKKTYITNSFNNIVDNRDETYIDNAAYTSAITYRFEGNDLTTSISRNPQLTSVKNDYALWGVRKTTTGQEVPIHLRYAIDHKPTEYHTIGLTPEEIDILNQRYGTHLNFPQGKTSIVYKTIEAKSENDDNNTKYVDWRELIYQMALDYRLLNHWDEFLVKLRDANCIIKENKKIYLYPSGYTGYEQYYIDMEAFWRQLYDPDNEGWNKNVNERPEMLNFWIDFIGENTELDKYSIPAIGDRTKVINDNKIKSIYFRETPSVIFTSTEKN